MKKKDISDLIVIKSYKNAFKDTLTSWKNYFTIVYAER